MKCTKICISLMDKLKNKQLDVLMQILWKGGPQDVTLKVPEQLQLGGPSFSVMLYYMCPFTSCVFLLQ